MKRKNFLIIGLIVGLVAAYFIWANFLKTAPSTAKRDTEVEVSAVDLYNAFEADEVNANTLYLNKIIEVRGAIASIDNSDDLKPSLSLTTEGFGVITCSFETAENFKTDLITIGSEITIKGECIGYLLDVQIRNSIIIND